MSRKRWIWLHLGTLAATFGGWMLVGYMTQSIALTAGWLLVGIVVFVNLPGRERINDT